MSKEKDSEKINQPILSSLVYTNLVLECSNFPAKESKNPLTARKSIKMV
jgi:hypothetical protein